MDYKEKYLQIAKQIKLINWSLGKTISRIEKEEVNEEALKAYKDFEFALAYSFPEILKEQPNEL